MRHPGACVGGQTELQPRIIDLIQGLVLSQFVPERVAAAARRHVVQLPLRRPPSAAPGEYYTHYNFEGIGWGGRATGDGNDAQIAPHGNCQNTPIEVFETRYPWLHERYGLQPRRRRPGPHARRARRSRA